MSRMDGSAPLPSDLIKRNGETRMVEMVFTGSTARWPYRREKLTQSFPILPSGLVRFALTIPDNFTKIDMRVSVSSVICIDMFKKIFYNCTMFRSGARYSKVHEWSDERSQYYS